MLLGVVSDSHGHIAYTLAATRMLAPFRPAAVLHCGDIGSPEIPELFDAWPTHFVFGNVDVDEADLQQAIGRAGQTCHGRFGELELGGRRVAFLHGDDSRRLQRYISDGQWDVVCYGHTHRAEQHRVGRTLVLNPGAIYRASPHSVAVIDLVTLDVTQLDF